MAFQDFLKSEYSEENILFWLACEEYKKITSPPEMISRANQIYTEFVQTEAPRQVNDSPLSELCSCNGLLRESIVGGDIIFIHSFKKKKKMCYPYFQVNIDSGTRTNITNNISEPNLSSFDTAQKMIFSLMARDCYPRFLKSDIYQSILQKHGKR